jgi:very-short-patch-repair endonuclease
MRRDPFYVERARELRRDMNEAEKRIWYRVRANRLGGHRFRRQYPMGQYIVDFVCLRSRLVVEIDGETHGDDRAERNDARRAAWIEARGFRVMRLWNDYVLNHTDEAVESILDVLTELGSPSSVPA